MSSQAIKEAALNLFALHGYEGTSLSDIAHHVGIKKQSIYSHFNGKDDLFLQVLEETFIAEKKREDQYFQTHTELALQSFLFEALQSFIQRYHDDNRLQFWLRNTFLPPGHLYDQVIYYLYEYIDYVDGLYLRRFQHAFQNHNITQPPKKATMAFSALLDSIGVEMVYGGEVRTKRKLEAAWQIFWIGITNTEASRK